MISTLDLLNGSTAFAIITIHDIASSSCISAQNSICTFACTASHILRNVLNQNLLYMLHLVLPFENQLLLFVHIPLCSQLHQEERLHMLRFSLHEIADFLEVSPGGLSSSDSSDLRRLHDVFGPLACGRVVLRDLVCDSLEEPAILVVGDVELMC